MIKYNSLILKLIIGYLESFSIDLIEETKNYFILLKILKRQKTKVESTDRPFKISIFNKNREEILIRVFTKDMPILNYIVMIDEILDVDGFIKLSLV